MGGTSDGKTPIRFVIWVWDRGVDDFTNFCLPSVMQPENIPWVVSNGYPVVLDFYTIERDADRVRKLAQDMHDRLAPFASDPAALTASVAVAPNGRTPFDIKAAFFQVLVRTAVETRSHGLFVFADMYFGNGSIRNIVTYGQKPRVTVGGIYLRVKQQRFAELLAHHHAVTGSETISNARLVDIALDSLIDAMQASLVDEDANASLLTSGSIRRITDDLFTYTFHAPTPILFFFEESDVRFFSRFSWNFYLLDHIWPTMLAAQNRWRMMTSSDLFFLAEHNGPDVEAETHSFPLQDGMLYNDDFDQEHLHGRINQTMLMTLRRERLPTER
jgi:hypothetical protein